MKSFEKRELAQRAACVAGVDAGKFQHALVVRPRGRQDSRPLAFPTTRPGFDQALAFLREQAALSGDPAGDAAGEILVGVEFAGVYGFTLAHYLRAAEPRCRVVSILPAHTKRWKEVTHRQPLKTDAKDAVGICDLAAQGHFVSFPFLAPAYAELRYLLSAREKLSTLRRGVITRLRTSLAVVFPEFTDIFLDPAKRTARAVLRTYPGPEALLKAPRRALLALLKRESLNHLKRDAMLRLLEAARTTVALPAAQGAMRDEVPMIIERLDLYERQMRTLEGAMAAHVDALPAGRALLTIPYVAPVTAATFLGSLGDPRSYDSARQVIALAGLTLVERSSGVSKGEKHISKRGRPVLRKHAHMFAVRSVQRGGIFRREYDALLARNGRKTIPALTAVSRMGLRLLFSVARDERTWTPEPPARPGKPSGGPSGARSRP